ncbi:chemerin-like receptor 1 [Neosynchiropus ocellatus]
MDNTTAAGPPGDNKARILTVALLVLYCVICVLGTLGNGLVIYVTGFRMKKTVNSVWFLNLAIADFLFTFFMIFTTVSLSQDHRWPFGNIMCKLNSFVTVVNMFASVYFLMGISLDRCLSTWVVVWARNKRTVTKIQLASALIWGVAIICSTPFTVYRKVLSHRGNQHCGFNSTEYPSWSMGVFRFSAGFFVPFVIIFLCHVAIYRRVGRLHRTKKRRCNRIIFSVILAFFFCWFPQNVIQLVEISSGTSTRLRLGGALAVSLGYFNSCLNPILYVFMCEDFQKKLKKSIYVVLEAAFADEHASFASSRSLSSPLQFMSRKSESAETEDSVFRSGAARSTAGSLK